MNTRNIERYPGEGERLIREFGNAASCMSPDDPLRLHIGVSVAAGDLESLRDVRAMLNEVELEGETANRIEREGGDFQ